MYKRKLFDTRDSAKRFCDKVGGKIQNGRASKQGKIITGFWVVYKA